MSFLISPSLFAAAPPAGPTAIWDAAHKNADITLSDTDHTATATATAGYRNVLGLPGVPPGGTGYFEADVVADGAVVGWGDSSSALNNFVGCDGHSIGLFHHGYITYAGGASGGHLTFAPGDVMMCVIDRRGGNAHVWFGKNGTWEGDPEAGTGDPGDLATFTGDVTPIFGADSTYAASLTLRTVLAYSPPSWASVL